ncbi:hypothetical protein KI387_016678, partial [Taxus chinensis]
MDGAPWGRRFSTCSTHKRRALRAHEFMMQQAERVRHWRGFFSCNRAGKCAMGAQLFLVLQDAPMRKRDKT